MKSLVQCHFNFNLLYDFNNLVLAIIRHTQPKLDLQQLVIQQDPLKFVLQSNDKTKNQQLDILKNNLLTVKPQIGALETLEFLRSHGVDYQIFTNLPKELDLSIRDSLNLPDLEDPSLYKRIIKFDHSLEQPQDDQDLSNEQNKQTIERYIIKNFCLKDTTFWETQNYIEDLCVIDWLKILNITDKPNFTAEEYKVSLNKQCLDLSIQEWNNHLILKPSIKVQSKVVQGFGRGGKLLGIPTANLEMTEQTQSLIEDLLPGVYAGIVHMQDKTYGGVMSIGFNPYYQNALKTVEVHVFEEFDSDFYLETIEIEILFFLRAESDFKQFSYLIKYINNDVFTARNLLSKVMESGN